MITSRSHNTSINRLPLILPNTGDTSHRQQQPQPQPQQILQETPRRPRSNASTKSMDNPFSLEHLFSALRRRIRRIIQTYNVASFHHALKICAGVFQSYASYNLNTIDEFARRLNKSSRDNKQVLTIIDQFRLQLSELRHCHSTFEAELLVTTLAIDFHENDSDHQQTTLLLSTGKFSPRSRLSKFRVQHIRQAMEFKSQLKQTNEDLQILLYDEFNANLTTLWEESEKYVSAAISFHDHHMTYVLRLLPDIALKFEYALQLCTKLFELETTMLENFSQPIANNKNFSEATPVTTITLTPRSDYNPQQQSMQLPKLSQEIPQKPNNQNMQINNNIRKTSAFFSGNITGTSSSSTPAKFNHIITNSIDQIRQVETLDIVTHDDNPLIPPLFSSSEQSFHYKDDQTKLHLLVEQLNKRLIDEESYHKRLLDCTRQIEKKSEQINRFSNNTTSNLVEYQKKLYLSDLQIHKSVANELNIAVREAQYRIDWIKMVQARAQQCLGD